MPASLSTDRMTRNLQQRCSTQYQSNCRRLTSASWDTYAGSSIGGGSRGSVGSGPATNSDDSWTLVHRRQQLSKEKSRRKSRKHNRLREELDKRPPREMTQTEAEQLAARYRRKLSSKHSAYELVATFLLASGRVEAYHVYGDSSSTSFRLTERRSQLLSRYYGRGTVAVAHYVKIENQFEYYMPLSLSTAGDTASCSDEQHSRSSTPAGRGGINRLRAFLGLFR